MLRARGRSRSAHYLDIQQGLFTSPVHIGLRAVGWRDDPHVDEAVFPGVFEATGGVPRRINALFSRLLLLGCLEERHHLRAEDVKQVAEDLERETETVLDHSEDNQPVPHISLSGGGNQQHTVAIAKLEERMDALEDSVQRWDRTFRKALNTFSDYLQAVSGDLRKSGEP